MQTNKVLDLNLDLTISSGQVFLWNKLNECWYGIEMDKVIKVSMNNNEVEYSSYPDFVDCRKIFRLDDDLVHIRKELSKDAVIRNTLSSMHGLRLMRQNPYQCLISFICATNTSVSMIRHMLGKMSLKFGEKLVCDEMTFHTFPEPEQLASAGINELCDCSVGYRARFIKRAAKAALDREIDFDYLKHTSYENAKTELMQLLGVGPKVADCILLFSLEKLESFPIDVWIARIVKRYYQHICGNEPSERLTPKMYRIVSSKMREYFGKHAGYAQQYLYCYSR
ncbi:MAG: DNA glycosylase, partial [Nitrososphaerales archaeon]